VSEERARLDALGRIDYPQFSVQGLASARGTGMVNNGERLGALNGMAPTVQNYAVGLTVTFPFMERYAIREQEAAQTANLRAAQAQSQVIATQLETRYNAAAATLAGARRVAEITPVEVSSARAALDQATARYQAGLAPIDDVAQSQRLLVQAQIDNALARLSVWRARLEMDAARGDIQPFITEAGR
jgi:outer membrane protein TolC